VKDFADQGDMMSDHIASQLSSKEIEALRAALVTGTFTAAAGDLGRAVMSAYVMWHSRVGALAPLHQKA
jgi:dihydroxyacetone kinase DhaKLM complex PTS-EIIA-like component DhaM